MCDSQGWQDLTLLDGVTLTVQTAHIAALAPGKDYAPGSNHDPVACTVLWLSGGQRFAIKETVTEIWGTIT